MMLHNEQVDDSALPQHIRPPQAAVPEDHDATAPLSIHDGLAVRVAGNGILWASAFAVTTSDTLCLDVGQRRVSGNALRVAAPEAAQRAPFQEYRRADTRPVVDREALDIEDTT